MTVIAALPIYGLKWVLAVTVVLASMGLGGLEQHRRRQ